VFSVAYDNHILKEVFGDVENDKLGLSAVLNGCRMTFAIFN
jgi:hypothetical protein